MYSPNSFNKENIRSILQPVTEIYGGADSRVYHAYGFAIHWYKDHVDQDLFQLYLAATENAKNILNGLFAIPAANENIEVWVNPILSWFVDTSGAIISVSQWIDGSNGMDLRHDHYKKHYLDIIPALNERLMLGGSPMGAEVVALNTRYTFPRFRNVKCVITDVGNGLRYLRSGSYH